MSYAPESLLNFDGSDALLFSSFSSTSNSSGGLLHATSSLTSFLSCCVTAAGLLATSGLLEAKSGSSEIFFK